MDNESFFLLLQVTLKCNQKCVFCSTPYQDKELNLDKAKKIIKETKEDKKIGEVVFTGGEPTKHPDLFEMINYAKNLGLRTRIITNGIKLGDQKFFDGLIKSGIDEFCISLHSHTKKTQERLTGIPGGFDKTLEGIKNVVEQKNKLSILFTINSKNYKEIPEFADFINNRFGRNIHFIFNFTDPTGRVLKNKEIAIRFVDFEKELIRIRELEAKGLDYEIESVPLCYMEGIEHRSSETNGINSKGGYYVYDLEKEEVYGGRVSEKIEKLYTKGEVCEECKKKEVCAGVLLNYKELFGMGEIYPIFENEESSD